MNSIDLIQELIALPRQSWESRFKILKDILHLSESFVEEFKKGDLPAEAGKLVTDLFLERSQAIFWEIRSKDWNGLKKEERKLTRDLQGQFARLYCRELDIWSKYM